MAVANEVSVGPPRRRRRCASLTSPAPVPTDSTVTAPPPASPATAATAVAAAAAGHRGGAFPGEPVPRPRPRPRHWHLLRPGQDGGRDGGRHRRRHQLDVLRRDAAGVRGLDSPGGDGDLSCHGAWCEDLRSRRARQHRRAHGRECKRLGQLRFGRASATSVALHPPSSLCSARTISCLCLVCRSSTRALRSTTSSTSCGRQASAGPRSMQPRRLAPSATARA